MKEEKIKNLISSRSTMERRLQRVEEERDGLAQLNMDLLIVKANLNGEHGHACISTKITSNYLQ